MEIAGLFLGFVGGILGLFVGLAVLALLVFLLALPLGTLSGMFREGRCWLRRPSRARFGLLMLRASTLSLFVLAIAMSTQLVCWGIGASAVEAAASRTAGWSLLTFFLGFPLGAWLHASLDHQDFEGAAGQSAAADNRLQADDRG